MFTQKNLYKKIKKRPFLLLEVLIAFALVSLCAIPLLRPQLFIYSEEKRFIRELDLDRLVKLEYMKTLEELYKAQIAWDSIEEGVTVPIHLMGYEGVRNLSFGKYDKKGEGEAHYYLLELSFLFDISKSEQKKYAYYVYVKRDPLSVKT